MNSPKRPRKSRVLTGADRLRIMLESYKSGAVVSAVARRHGVDPSALSRWRRSYREANPGGANPQTVPVSELAVATQRIRDLERELGRTALENAMLLEAVQFAATPTARRERAARVKKRNE